MKRSSHSSSNAAVLGLKPLKGFQRVRIADHTRDLPSAGYVRGLPLCAGLWLGHGSTQQLAKFSGNGHGAAIKVGRNVEGLGFGHALEHTGSTCGGLRRDGAPFGRIGAETIGDGLRVGLVASHAKGKGGDLGGGELVNGLDHGWLRWVTVEPYCHVTSDGSTTVGREFGSGA